MGDNRRVRTPRLYHPSALRDGAEIRLDRDRSAHVQRVLRLGAGDAVSVFDGEGHEHRGRIISPGRDGVRVELGERIDSRPESPLQSWLLQGVCRGPRMDLVIQKATELGVARIVPVTCERSVVRLDEKRAERRREHWQGVAVAAAEQCGRARVPRIDPPCALADGLALLPADGGLRILLSPDAGRGLGSLPAASRSASLLVGPEGGLTPGESRLAGQQGFVDFALGPRILRTETAALTALALVQFLRGDLGGA